MSRSLGIDIGKTGAAAVIDTAAGTRKVKLAQLLDLPMVGIGTASESLDLDAYLSWLRAVHPRPDRAVLENVRLRPPFHATHGSGFMKLAGALAGTTRACGIPVYLVEPNVWKRRFGLSGKEAGSYGERLACELAARIFKSDAEKFAKVSQDHNRAEAALLGAFAGDDILSSLLKPYPG